MAWREGASLYPYQQRAADVMVETDVLLAFDMGCGKTPTTLHALEALRDKGEVQGAGTVVVPASLKWQWRDEIEKFTDQSVVVIDGTPERRRAQYEVVQAGSHGYMVISYNTFAKDLSRLIGTALAFLVLDECFPDDTMVDTPDGPKVIQDMLPGDVVLGANGRNRVRRVVSRITGNLVRVVFADGSEIVCTPNHRFFTAVGWEEARMLNHGTEIIRTDEAMRMVRSTDRGGGDQEAFLRDVLLCEMEDVPARDKGKVTYRRGEEEEIGEEPSLVRVSIPGGAVTAGSSSKVRLDGRVAGEVRDHLEGQRERDQRSSGERQSAYTTGTGSVGVVGRGLGVELLDLSGSEDHGISDALQSRSGPSGDAVGGGSGRQLAPIPAGPGPQEGFRSGFLRVDRVEVLQPGDPEFDRFSGGSDRVWVTNLEVEGHPSYSVNGLLVHNCTAIKNYTTIRSQKIKKVRDRYGVRYALTGTPIENGRAEEIFSIMEFVDPAVFGNFWAFSSRYITRNDQKWIVGYRNLDDMNLRLAKYMMRATHAEPEVAKYLPKVLHRPACMVSLDTSTRRAVDAVTQDVLDELEVSLDQMMMSDMTDDSHPSGRLMARIQVLRMLLNSPNAVWESGMMHHADGDWGSEYALDVVKRGLLKGASAPKIHAVKQYVQDHLSIDPEYKAVVFSTFVEPAKALAREMNGRDRAVLYHGGMSSAQRREVIKDFRHVPDCRVLVATDAGGYGLNLPEANLVVNFDLPWQEGTLRQRNARIRRASSKWGSVIVQNFVVEDSIEERMLQMLGHKKAVAGAIVDGVGIRASGVVDSDLTSLHSFLTDMTEMRLIDAS